MGKDFLRVKNEMYAALKDKNMRLGIFRGMNSYLRNYQIIRDRPDVVPLREEVEEIKKDASESLIENYKRAMEALERNGVQTFYADTRQEALKRIGELVGTDNIIVKSKSMMAEELGLRTYLEGLGNEVWETDLGEFIIQLKGDRPAHMISPSLHIPKEEVAELFNRKFNVNLQPTDIHGMVAIARDFLREKLFKADVGIIGANAVSAMDGTVVTVENEANIRLTSSLPPKNIVVTGIEKVVPTTLDAVKTTLLQAYYGGSPIPTYVNLIAGPSGTRDIEKTLVRPAQGSKEMFVVFVNNGRMEALKSPLSEALRCIRCGACQLVCPIYSVVGPTWGGSIYTAATGILWTAITEGIEVAKPLSYFCLECGACNEVCPVGIDISGIIRWLKKEASEELIKELFT